MLARSVRFASAGACRRVDSRESGKTWERLCSPLRVLALSRDRSGRGWGRLVEVIDPDGKAYRCDIVETGNESWRFKTRE